MTTSLKFYADAALTTPLTTETINHNVDGSGDPQDVVLYLGSTAATFFRNVNDPGVDDLVLTIGNVTAVWQASTAYVADALARTTAKNGYKYKVQSITGGGVSGASEPTWPTTIGNTVVDNQVTWVCLGKLHESTEIKLALSSGGLASAVAGASLVLGTELQGGSSNALPIYLRIDDATAVLGSVSELQLIVNDVQESAT